MQRQGVLISLNWLITPCSCILLSTLVYVQLIFPFTSLAEEGENKLELLHVTPEHGLLSASSAVSMATSATSRPANRKSFFKTFLKKGKLKSLFTVCKWWIYSIFCLLPNLFHKSITWITITRGLYRLWWAWIILDFSCKLYYSNLRFKLGLF